MSMEMFSTILDKSISQEARAALEEMGYTIEGPEYGYFKIVVPSSDISYWESEDNGASYDIIIKGRRFWQNVLPDRPQFGLQLEGSQESNRIYEESIRHYTKREKVQDDLAHR